MSRTNSSALARRLDREADGIGRRVWARIGPQLGEYVQPVAGLGTPGDDQPNEDSDAWWSAFCARILRAGLAAFATGGELPEDDRGALAVAGVRLGESGQRIAPLLEAFETGCSALIAECWTTSVTGEHATLTEFTTWLTQQVHVVIGHLGVAYADGQKQAGLDCPPRRLLAELLLNGAVTEGLAVQARHIMSDRYVVLAVRLAGDEPIDVSGVARAAGALARDDVGLCCEMDNRLCVLAPVRSPASAAESCRRVTAALGCVGITFAGPVGSVVDVREELSAAVQRALVVENVASVAGFTNGPVSENQVVSELAICRDRRLRDGLVRAIAPLQQYPELIYTLEALYRHDLDRTRTASSLNVVRRTLSYRINRIEDLTGLSPVRPRGIQTFTLALSARKLAS